MYSKIKELTAAAVALQNKGAMDAALREIGVLAEQAIASGVGEVGHMGFGGNQIDAVWIDEAPQAGDAVRITGTSDGEGNEKVLSVKVTPAKKGAK